MVRGQPGRNDFCPCGSGKKYKKCCFGTVKEVAFINYQGLEAQYPAEEARLAYDKFMLWLKETSGMRCINENKGLEILRQLYNLYEGVQKYFSPYYSCTKGCGYCCYPYVGVSMIESRFTGLYIKSNFSSESRVLFLRKISGQKKDYLSLHGTDKIEAGHLQAEYFTKQIPCPFLSEDQACRIYPARPLACRALAVISNPEECKYDRVKEHFVPYDINGYAVNAVLALSKKVFGAAAGIKHFPAWFIDGFDTSGTI
jgi:Fe-S-cluster containining protein